MTRLEIIRVRSPTVDAWIPLFPLPGDRRWASKSQRPKGNGSTPSSGNVDSPSNLDAAARHSNVPFRPFTLLL